MVLRGRLFNYILLLEIKVSELIERLCKVQYGLKETFGGKMVNTEQFKWSDTTDSLRGPIVKMPKLAYEPQSDFNFVFGLVVPKTASTCFPFERYQSGLMANRLCNLKEPTLLL